MDKHSLSAVWLTLTVVLPLWLRVCSIIIHRLKYPAVLVLYGTLSLTVLGEPCILSMVSNVHK